MPIRVTVWNENHHEQENPEVAEIYPHGIHGTIAAALKGQGCEVRTATQDQPGHGLGGDILEQTDVLIWWGHMLHDDVSDQTVARVHARVLGGMGLVVLHSGHNSKIFRTLMGTTCDLKYRASNDRERLWVVAPGHPIVEGIGEYLELEVEEMYGEPFDIPTPDELIFVSWFTGGEIFRSGATYTRGRGKVFYFRPGHESLPTYHNVEVQRVIGNGVRWAAPPLGADVRVFGNSTPLEKR